MQLTENIRLALRGVWVHKLRAALTMLGIMTDKDFVKTIHSGTHGVNAPASSVMTPVDK